MEKKAWKCLCTRDPNIGLFNLNKPKIDTPYWRLELKNEQLFTFQLFKMIESMFNKSL